MLRVIRTFFMDRTIRLEEHEKLWKVLTAFRGPDSESVEEKACTTAVIRETALPGVSQLAFFSDDSSVYAKRRTSLHFTSNHFLSHATAAFTALGLDWDKFNPPK